MKTIKYNSECSCCDKEILIIEKWENGIVEVIIECEDCNYVDSEFYNEDQIEG